MKKLGILAGLVVAVMGSGIALSACGSSSSSGKEGGVLQGAYTSFPDYMDPQISYTAEGWTTMQNVYIPLLTYNHAEGVAGGKVIPGLAEALPKITNGGKTYKMTLRKGLKYSDGTPVKASDFRTRSSGMFMVNSGGAAFYTDIVGAAQVREDASTRPHPRDQGQRPDRRDHDQPGAATRHVHQRAGADVRRAGAAGHPGQGPEPEPSALDRALHDHQVRPGPRLDA